MASIMQSNKVDKEKLRKLEGIKHVAFAIDKMEVMGKPNYIKLKPLTLLGINVPTKHMSFL